MECNESFKDTSINQMISNDSKQAHSADMTGTDPSTGQWSPSSASPGVQTLYGGQGSDASDRSMA